MIDPGRYVKRYSKPYEHEKNWREDYKEKRFKSSKKFLEDCLKTHSDGYHS